MSNDKLKLYQALPLGVGSIIGSGILFLPSLTFSTSGSDVVLAWVLTTFLCIPGVIFFKDMVKRVPPGEGMAGFVSLGLGDIAGNSVYFILLGTVIFGMPSAAIIAGDYLTSMFGINSIGVFASYLLIAIAVFVNLKGLKTSANLSLVISLILILTAVLLIFKTSGYVNNYEAIKPQFNLSATYSGMVLAFWAFAGFENLTFLYSRFQNPNRDLVLTILVSIIVCGVLYIGLVVNYAAIVPMEKIEATVGLLQISRVTGSNFVNLLITIFAFLAVAINLISWTGGVASMIAKTAQLGLLPKKYSAGENNKNAIYLLATLFLVNTTIGLVNRELFLKILEVVSTNFLLIYVLSMVSYSIFTTSKIKKISAILISFGMCLALTSTGYILIYPVSLILLSSFVTMKRKIEKAVV